MKQSAINNRKHKLSFKKILIPTDFSEASWQAIEHGLNMAQIGDARLIFVHILDQPPINPAIIPDRYIKEIQAERIKKIKRQLQAYEEYCEQNGRAKIQHKSIVIPGRAASKILQMAKMEEADLIILGSAGASRLMESVSLEVIDKAECAILSIPQRSSSQAFSDLIFLPRTTQHSKTTLDYLKQLCATYQLALQISPNPLNPNQDLRHLRLAGSEALPAIMLDREPASRLQQKKWIQTLIRDEHMPLFVFHYQTHLNDES